MVDEDIGIDSIPTGDNTIEEDAPTVAEVIDERPIVEQQMEIFSSSDKWRKMDGKGSQHILLSSCSFNIL